MRGKGTFIAWDSPRRDELVRRAKELGVNIGGSGERAVRLRPMLVFGKRHGEFFSVPVPTFFPLNGLSLFSCGSENKACNGGRKERRKTIDRNSSFGRR